MKKWRELKNTEERLPSSHKASIAYIVIVLTFTLILTILIVKGVLYI